MPRGVYNRKGKVQKALPPGQISAIVSAAETIDAFKSQVNSYHRQSLLVTCSAVVCLVVGVHSRDGEISYEDTTAKLRHAIMQRGIQDAQINKYIGVARALTNWLIHKHKVGGPVLDILKAATATDAINDLAGHLAKQKVNTLEDLTNMLGKYKRSPVRKSQPTTGAAPSAGVPTQMAAPAGGPPSALIAAAEAAVAQAPTEASPSIVPEAEEAQPTVPDIDVLMSLLKITPVHLLVPMMIRAGHQPVDIACDAIAFLRTDEDIVAVEQKITMQWQDYREKREDAEKRQLAATAA